VPTKGGCAASVRQEGKFFVMRKILSVLFALVFLALTPVSATAQQNMSGNIPGPAYRISPGDDLEIMVWGDERLQKDVRVLPDGSFGFPLVGQIMAAGLLPSELERVITVALRPQYRDAVPQVTVTVKNPNGYQFSVIGKVKSPGTYTPGRYVSALEAIGIAGGPTEFADINKIRIVRKVGGRVVTIPVQVGPALKGDFSHLMDVPSIQSGDTMVVP
jgi:polysaccharide biosynthesis/export protein